MRRFAEACDVMAATRSRIEKVRALTELLRGYSPADASAAAVFLGGRPFPASSDRTLDVGGALLQRAVQDVTGASDDEIGAAYRRHGDLGAATQDLLQAKAHAGSASRAPSELQLVFAELAAARGPASKLPIVRELLATSTPLEAKYIVKIITSELRIGSKESLVLEAIATAFDAPVEDVQRADMLLGDAGKTLELAREGRLAEARLTMFRAVAPMLASPAASSEEAFERLPDALVEDKYDGIRAQAHVAKGAVRLFSRTSDEVTAAFPELVPELARFGGEVVLDGEILGWKSGRAMPFSSLQKRLGRKKPSAAVLREVPVAFVAFDVLHDRDLLLDLPLRERRASLEKLFATRSARPLPRPRAGQLALFAVGEPEPTGVVLLAEAQPAESIAGLDALFEAARARGNEGLMVKDPSSPYSPGRRGKSWLKLKRELATLDVVVTAVEYGHGKRAGVISDYTFSVRDGDVLVAIGKAYTGLTDAEIAELTPYFVEHTVAREGHLLIVEPLVVLEVAFNNMMKTKRHPSGLALRFPRIVRLRPDKKPEDADTLETARAIYARQ